VFLAAVAVPLAAETKTAMGTASSFTGQVLRPAEFPTPRTAPQAPMAAKGAMRRREQRPQLLCASPPHPARPHRRPLTAGCVGGVGVGCAGVGSAGAALNGSNSRSAAGAGRAGAGAGAGSSSSEISDTDGAGAAAGRGGGGRAAAAASSMESWKAQSADGPATAGEAEVAAVGRRGMMAAASLCACVCFGGVYVGDQRHGCVCARPWGVRTARSPARTASPRQ
jgi:hypothetical protein